MAGGQSKTERYWTRLRGRVAVHAVRGLLLCGVMGVGVQLFARDRWSITAPLFYVASLPVVCATFLAVAVITFRDRKRRPLTVGSVLLAIGTVALLVQSSWCGGGARAASPADVPDGPGLRVLSWNLFHGRLGTERVAARVKESAPDVAALVECGPLEDAPEIWGRSLPGYTVVPFGREIVVCVRGRLRGTRLISLGDGSRLALGEAWVDGRRFHIAVVDLVSNPFRARHPVFARLEQELAALGDEPTILLGDFNTPRRSTVYDSLRTRWRHAFEEAGTGFGFTWPNPFPLWDLDQVWVSPQWRVRSCQSQWTTTSDHCPVITVLD